MADCNAICPSPNSCEEPSHDGINDTPFTNEMTYKSAREIMIQNLSARYKWYLQRYLAAYRHKNTATDPATKSNCEI